MLSATMMKELEQEQKTPCRAVTAKEYRQADGEIFFLQYYVTFSCLAMMIQTTRSLINV
jgi:hypothetical protein